MAPRASVHTGWYPGVEAIEPLNRYVLTVIRREVPMPKKPGNHPLAAAIRWATGSARFLIPRRISRLRVDCVFCLRLRLRRADELTRCARLGWPTKLHRIVTIRRTGNWRPL